LVELQKGTTGLGLSLAGNRDRTKMSVFICGMHPKGSAAKDGRICVGDEILEVCSGFYMLTFFTYID
jgi:multiple pdz domain protein, putative